MLLYYNLFEFDLQAEGMRRGVWRGGKAQKKNLCNRDSFSGNAEEET